MNLIINIAGAVVVAAILACVAAYQNYQDRIALEARGCVLMGKPNVRTEIVRGVTVFGEVWFCRDTNRNK